uniref:Uncharacterized protein n=1 Tax=Anguilla anguilla TaxID=7936 RepID=A0A0E9PG98_ANGAN
MAMIRIFLPGLFDILCQF